MPDRDSDRLDKLAESIADGDPIDWDALEQLPPDDERRKLLRNLRLLADVADLHRSRIDDLAPAEDDLSTEVAGTEAGPGGPDAQLPSGDASKASGLGQWGHLRLLRKIGEGTYGEVYHAVDTWLDHPVALKLLKPEFASRDFPSILREARKLVRIRHPNVVTVHGAHSHNGRVGFWMDLVEGDTLADLVAQGRMSPGEATHIGQEVCKAVAAVHQAKLVHRDIKAQNVMRAADGGRIILMDFGAGEFMDQPSARSRARGTPLYLAPELFEHSEASIQTDIYAVGVLLFYLVTGSFPVQASSKLALVLAHQSGQRRHLRDVRADLPDSFVTVVERALDRDPARRYTSAGEMYAALAREGPIPVPVPVPPRPPWVSRAVRVGLAAAGVLVTIEVFGLFESRVFEVVLRVDPAFAADPADYFTVGANALVPFTVVWSFAAAACAVLAGLRALIWPHTVAVRRRCSALIPSMDPSTLAGIILLVGVAGLVALQWSFWDVYTALGAMALDQRPERLDLSILGPAGRSLHRAHSWWTAALAFLLGLAAWRWFPRMEKRAADPSRVRTLRWATFVVAFLVVAFQAAPRPIIWDDREVVSFGNQTAFVIGSSGQELLLYTPAFGERKYIRVRVDAPDLRRNVASRALFEQERVK